MTDPFTLSSIGSPCFGGTYEQPCPGKLVLKETTIRGTYYGKPIDVTVEALVCPLCGDASMTEALALKYEEACKAESERRYGA